MTIAAQAVLRFVLFACLGCVAAFWTWAWMSLFADAPLDTFSAFVGIGMYQSLHVTVQMFGIYGNEKEKK